MEGLPVQIAFASQATEPPEPTPHRPQIATEATKPPEHRETVTTAPSLTLSDYTETKSVNGRDIAVLRGEIYEALVSYQNHPDRLARIVA